MLNMAMAWPFSLFLLHLLVAGQGSMEFLTLHDPTSTHDHPSLALSLNNQHLTEVSSSVLMAETWLRTHVLASYPGSKITHIVVGHNLLCFPHKTETQKSHLVLPALKNLHHSLTRWGLEREIEVSPSLSSHCLDPNLAHSLTKPLLQFIQTTNSTYLLNPIDQETESLLNTHLKFIKKMGFLKLGKINLVVETLNEAKPAMRKLSFVQSFFPIGNVPHLGLSPAHSPHPGHHHHHLLPPCNPTGAPPRTVVAEEKQWCVAKPSVPEKTLQVAMDYACGEGAECDEIKPNGSCYYPTSLVAHASFAFNSYWQKTKKIGGTCNFGGTAMLINSDPSYLHCKFSVS